ncbi:hypothetical protein [Neolewinella sp.]|uniref:hypothetical protein n=1 Tax=Neolewinella sp. TaxID=2993543 RepID=UPI003B52D6DE
MRQIILIVLLTLLGVSCDKELGIIDLDLKADSEETAGFEVIAEFPENSGMSPIDVTFSSIFTENALKRVEVPLGDGLELAFATNSEGDIVLMTLFNPSATEKIVMNARTTALALVMLHPWAVDLTNNAKFEAMIYMESLPEFTKYVKAVERSISQHAINPLVSESVLNQLLAVQRIIAKDVNIPIEPLRFKISPKKATVTNEISSATYSIGLYNDKDELVSLAPAYGLNKTAHYYYLYRNGTTTPLVNGSETATLTIPSDGIWTLKANHGLPLDKTEEGRQATGINTVAVISNLLGLFSNDLKEAAQGMECRRHLVERIFSAPGSTIDVAEELVSFANGDLGGAVLTYSMTKYVLERYDDVVQVTEKCLATGATKLVMKNSIKQIFGLMEKLGQLKTVFNGSAMLTDWLKYKKEIQYCFAVNGDRIETCKPCEDRKKPVFLSVEQIDCVRYDRQEVAVRHKFKYKIDPNGFGYKGPTKVIIEKFKNGNWVAFTSAVPAERPEILPDSSAILSIEALWRIGPLNSNKIIYHCEQQPNTYQTSSTVRAYLIDACELRSDYSSVVTKLYSDE